MTPQQVADHLGITRLQAAYADVVDRRAWDELVDLAERSRGDDDWSLRSALVRYAQPEPARVAALLSLVRRWDAAVHEALPALRAAGERYLAAASGPATGPDDESDLDPTVVGLLRVGRDLDAVGDAAAAWAVAREGDPGPDIDLAIERVGAALDDLGVAEEQPVPRGMRGRG